MPNATPSALVGADDEGFFHAAADAGPLSGVIKASDMGLVEALTRHACERGTDTALTFAGNGPERSGVTYQMLDDRARACAALLKEACPHGGHVLLPMKTDLLPIVTLLGCLYAGLACAPIPTPRGDAGMTRLRRLAEDPHCAAVAATAADLSRFGAAVAAKGFASDSPLPPRHAFQSNDGVGGLALIQYTSGSSSAPKGVMLTHANVAANLEMLRTAFAICPQDSFASWLPLFHDMGLAMLLMPLYFGCPGVLMSPTSFARDPARWLDTVARDRITITGAPNFAYELCARRIPTDMAARLDLSRLRLAFNGAEPVRRTTMQRFSERLASANFRPSAFFPCYGLAEAVTFVSGGHADPTEAPPEGPAPCSERPVRCGKPASGSVVAVVDARMRPLPDGIVGEICVAGPHVGLGYLGQPAATAAMFGVRLDGHPDLRFLRTGDLGFLNDGRLSITGRLKDLVIHRGVNLHAVDIEDVASSSHPGLDVGAAFAYDRDGTEEVVIVQEIARGAGLADAGDTMRVLEEAIAMRFGIRPFDIVLLRAGSIPRTTSGKLRRDSCRQLYEANELKPLSSLRSMKRTWPSVL